MPRDSKTAGAYPVWSEEEDNRLLDLCRDRQIRGDEAWMDMAKNFPGRSMVAVRQRYLTLRNRTAGIERDRHPRPRKVNKGRARRVMPEPAVDIPKPPEYTSLTAFLCGDPLPGRSALDQKRSQTA